MTTLCVRSVLSRFPYYFCVYVIRAFNAGVLKKKETIIYCFI